MGGEAEEAGPGRVPMVLFAETWSLNVQLGRGGREEGDRLVVTGAIAFRGADGGMRRLPARANFIRREANTRLDVTLAEDGASVMTVPLEEGAMLKLNERLRELVSGLGMRLGIAFAAIETYGATQQIDRVTFAFSSDGRGRNQE